MINAARRFFRRTRQTSEQAPCGIEPLESERGFRLIGRIDPDCAHALRKVIEPELHGTLVLDLAAVESVSSSYLSILIWSLKRLQEKGGSLVLRNPRDSVLHVLEWSGVPKLPGLRIESDGGNPERKTKVLFVCDQNRLRSPTAQSIFGDDPRLEVRSAGIRADAAVGVTRELLEWADVIFVMEKSQRNLIHKRFEDVYRRKRIVCLYIPDEYDFMDPALVRLLTERVTPHLPGAEQRREP